MKNTRILKLFESKNLGLVRAILKSSIKVLFQF